jgi:hypothetical protein
MTVDFTSEEASLLVDELRGRLGEMREEVYHSETPKFRDELKQRKNKLIDVIEKLERAAGPIEINDRVV